MKYYIGIDVGGTGIKCGMVDAEGKVIAYKKCDTRKGVPPEAVISDMADLAESLINETGIAPLGVGVGCPGSINTEKGTVVYSNNLEWNDVPIVKLLKERLSLPVYITNDANAAALGEYVCGAGKKYRSLVLLTLGTGVGGGVVIDGKLFEGSFGAGTELGHEVIRFGGEKCTCGRRGCFEAYASATALVRQASRAMDNDGGSLLWRLAGSDKKRLNGKVIFDAYREGDKTAIRVVKKYTDYLAAGIANVINAFRPEAVVIGGGICAASDVFLPSLIRKVRRQMYGGNKYAPVDILIAALGNDAGICGAAALAFDK